MKDLTANCAEGRHALCRCEDPGQDTKWAGLIVEWDETIGGLIPGAYCQCPCHGAIATEEVGATSIRA